MKIIRVTIMSRFHLLQELHFFLSFGVYRSMSVESIIEKLQKVAREKEA
jgi:hypothetical protein